MPITHVEQVQSWLRAHEAELLSDTQSMLRIPSLKGSSQPGAPYGPENAKALHLALSMAEQFGMRTKNLDGHIGYAEIGSGNAEVLVLGHLDVVPVSDEWKHAPFGADIDEDYIYARGSVDDKGPTMAAFYAIRAIKEVLGEPSVRVRIAFGCDEESGMGCVEHYCKHEAPPTFGVAPDSMWPLVHGEKGISSLFVEVDPPQGQFALISASGGERLNVVIDKFTADVAVDPVWAPTVIDRLNSAWDRNITTEWISPTHLRVSARGKAAHGSTPFLGDSAATRVLRLLTELAPVDLELAYEVLLLSTHPSGAGLGIDGRDEPSDDLTCNLGIVRLEDGKLKLSFNVRYPTTWTAQTLADRCRTRLAKWPIPAELKSFDDSPPLYFPLEHPLVSTIVQAYQAETGDTTEPGVMGGGTYARKIPNTVSIGTGWAGDGRAHENDERLKVEHLYKMSRIYARILLSLMTQAQNS